MTHPLLASVLLISVLLVSVNAFQVNDTPFPQRHVQRWLLQDQQPLADWGSLPFNDVVDVAALPGSSDFIILSSTSIWRFNPTTGTATLLKRSFTRNYKVSSLAGNSGSFAIADELDIKVCTLPQGRLSCDLVALPSPSPVTALKYATSNLIYFASDQLYSLDLSRKETLPVGNVQNVTSIDYSTVSDSLAVGTPRKLWRFGDLPNRFGPVARFYRVDGLIDSAITSVAYADSGDLFIGSSAALNVLSNRLTFSRLAGGPGGLPYGNISSVVTSSSGAVWLGTDRGVVRNLNGTWKYFNGPRYMTDIGFGPGNQVKALAVGQYNGFDSVLIATGTGLSWLYEASISLQDKATYFQTLVSPYHKRFGLTASANLGKWGTMSSYQLTSSENDGLWTGMYLASQALRYAATGDPAAKAEADMALSGLELLNNVTGVAGLFARSVLKQDTLPGGHLPWRFSTTMPGWVWQGDTSSDEVTGHMFAYTLYHQLVAKTSDEKMRAAKLLTNCAAYIVKNNYYLLDVTGQRTTWGVWNPDYLNDNEEWFDQRGVNSLQILSWLTSAQTLAEANGMPSQLFSQAKYDLMTTSQYDINLFNTKIEIPNDDNYSDDELTFLPYYTYLMGKVGQPTSLEYPFHYGLDRAFDIIKTYKSPLWIFMYGAALQARNNPSSLQTTDVANAMQTLHDWPMSWIDWPIDNTQRLDLVLSQYLNRNNQVDMLTLLPYDEIGFFRWNTDPYRFQPTGSGFNLAEPTAFLLPYWLGRYHQIISPPTASS